MFVCSTANVGIKFVILLVSALAHRPESVVVGAVQTQTKKKTVLAPTSLPPSLGAKGKRISEM